jgi:hypothetical protein
LSNENVAIIGMPAMAIRQSNFVALIQG